MSNQVSGPYQINDDDIARIGTLDAVDLGEWFILLNGTYQFVDSEKEGERLIQLLNALE